MHVYTPVYPTMPAKSIYMDSLGAQVDDLKKEFRPAADANLAEPQGEGVFRPLVRTCSSRTCKLHMYAHMSAHMSTQISTDMPMHTSTCPLSCRHTRSHTCLPHFSIIYMLVVMTTHMSAHMSAHMSVHMSARMSARMSALTPPTEWFHPPTTHRSMP